MNYAYNVHIALTAITFLLVAGVVSAQEGGTQRESAPIMEQINVRGTEKSDAQDRADIEGGTESADASEGRGLVRAQNPNHDASRSNNTESKIDSSDALAQDGIDDAIQKERKRPGRVTYGNVTLERAFNTGSPYPNETQEIEAVQKSFLFGVIPVQVPVVARVSQDDAVEVIQRPWYWFLLWR